MARIKLELPAAFFFSTSIPIRITDLNYGGHVGNDTILSILHEARVKFLLHHGYKELDMGGVSLIMSDVAIEFKNELFYEDELNASVAVSDISKVSFDIYYKLEKKTGDKLLTVALAKTGMVCFDYKTRKVAAMPEDVKARLTQS
jgi:YbgC/YbaW family acyl-CoA thioester hydrolase